MQVRRNVLAGIIGIEPDMLTARQGEWLLHIPAGIAN
jgi:hypothetical protein